MVSAAPSPLPRVTLVAGPADPYNTAIAAARTCYAGRLITPEEVGASEASRDQRDRIARSTFEAGHHTVWQHAHFTFAVDQVSRHLVWSLLHAHPFYNSEQVSQRYVEVKPGRFTVPAFPDEETRALYIRTVAGMHACYAALVEELEPTAASAYFTVFPARRRKAAEYGKDIRKKAQEIARYALPVATHAHLYHTISALTLYRYWRLCEQADVPGEARALVEAMVACVRALDPALFNVLEDPLPADETLEARALEQLRAPAAGGAAAAFRREFDAALGGRVSVLAGHDPRAEATVAETVREMLALSRADLSDDDAIARVLDPARNPYLGGALNLLTTAKLPRALHHASYTFRKKLSHTADSQDQRHRMTPASRPVLARQVDLGAVDVVIPPMLAMNARALDRFTACMETVWQAMRTLQERAVPAAAWLYLLPNAFPIRFTESGDLLYQHHKWTTRLCFTAQEEIWRASVDEVEQVRAVHPRLGKWQLPPCGLRHRADITPYCPEGPRYCGVPAWKQDVKDYLRVI
ncbi:MAG: FAD-dependent thymidylate synthase [Deltaproteobacteria bacterium]|nr:FAD-dependent thymidylate synthase [Deltaproteobacteria bacterium]